MPLALPEYIYPKDDTYKTQNLTKSTTHKEKIMSIIIMLNENSHSADYIIY